MRILRTLICSFFGEGVGIKLYTLLLVLVNPLKHSNRLGECISLFVTYVPTNFEEGEGSVLWLHLYILPEKVTIWFLPFSGGAFEHANKDLFGNPSQSNLGPSLGSLSQPNDCVHIGLAASTQKIPTLKSKTHMVDPKLATPTINNVRGCQLVRFFFHVLRLLPIGSHNKRRIASTISRIEEYLKNQIENWAALDSVKVMKSGVGSFTGCIGHPNRVQYRV